MEGPIPGTLAKLTGPMVLGILGMVALNLVDTFFVGQLGSRELAAMSFTFPVIMVIGSISIGLGVGASSLISQAIGKDNQDEVRRLTSDSLVLATLVVTVLVTIGMFTIRPIFTLLGASEETLPLIEQYMQIWYPGMVFLVIPMVGNSAIRATGDTRTPSAIMLFAFTINLILDPLLIFGLGPFPRMELAGAAIATVTARAVTLLVSLHVLAFREKMLVYRPPSRDEVVSSWLRLLSIGLPNAAANMVMPLGMGFITRLVSGYGEPAVAAFGVAGRIDVFALTVVMALSSVLGPFVGQNFGARQWDRLREGVAVSKRFALLWGIGIALVFLPTVPFFAPLFNKDPQVVERIELYLRIVPWGYGAFGVYMLTRSSFNALEKPLWAAFLSATFMFVLFVPLAMMGSHFFGLVGVFGAGCTAYILTGVVAHLAWKRMLSRLR